MRCVCLIFFLCLRVECLLLEDDLSVATQIREVNSRFDGKRGEFEVEVVRNGAHGRVGLAHKGEHRFLVADIERSEDQTFAGIRCEKLRQVARVQIGQPDFRHFRVLEQIIRTRGALQSRA